MRRLLLAALSLAILLVAARARAGEPVRVLVPDRNNLQYMSFWIAKEGGFFADAGIDVEIVAPPGPQQAQAFWAKREAEIAVLPPPVYLPLIADKDSIVLVANLLQNDPIDLIVRKDILAERHLTRDMPLKARLAGLHGLKIGVAPHPPTRLRALFASQGLDADKELELVIIKGKGQNDAFADKRVDALYAHTPYLEHAIVQDGAVVLVEQTAGEAIARRQIHALCASRGLLERRRDLVQAMVSAIARAEASIHASKPKTVETLARAFPSRDRHELETIVALYEPAIPKTPEVRAEDLKPALDLFPAGMTKPSLEGIDLAQYVAPDLAKHATEGDPARRRWWIVAAVGAALLVAIVLAVRRRGDSHTPAT